MVISIQVSIANEFQNVSVSQQEVLQGHLSETPVCVCSQLPMSAMTPGLVLLHHGAKWNHSAWVAISQGAWLSQIELLTAPNFAVIISSAAY